MFIQNIDDGNKIRIVLPFKDEIAANAVRRQLGDLSNKIAVTLQPIFVSKKLEQDLKPKEIKSSIVSQPCVVYKFASDLCDADYCNIFLYVIFLLMNYNYFSCIYRTFILDFFSLDNEDR